MKKAFKLKKKKLSSLITQNYVFNKTKLLIQQLNKLPFFCYFIIQEKQIDTKQILIKSQ